MTSKHFAIVGYGNIGSRHAHIIDQMPEAELTACIDKDPEKQQSFGSHFVKPVFASLEQFFQADLDVDVVIIATPNGYHYEQALAAIEKGYHVLIEKPITLSTSACIELIQKAKAHDKYIFCVLQNRFSPPAQWLKQVVDDDKLGQIYMVDVHCFWNRDERYYQTNNWRGKYHLDGGTLFTQFSHFVDLLIWVFGDVRDANGSFFNFNHPQSIEFEDSGLIHLNMHSGAKVNFSYSTSVWDQNMESSISVIGEKGSLKIGGQYMDRIEHCHIKDYERPEIEPSNPPNQYGAFQGSAANHFYVLDNVVKALNQQSYQLAYPEEACKSIALIEHVYQDRCFS